MKKLLMFLCMFSAITLEAQASTSAKVVTTIAPLHSLVQGVMGSTGKAELLVHPGLSPHDVQLKPSQMKQLQQASLIFYIDDNLEVFLAKALGVVPESIRRIAMMDQSGIDLLKLRSGGNWEAHSHGEAAAHKDDAHADHGHSHGLNIDAHIWLDPKNAEAMVKVITKELSKTYPEYRSEYKANARALLANIDASDRKIKSLLSPYQKMPFIVFHDAYQYFEKRYGLKAVGSIVLDPSHPASVKRVAELKQKVTVLKVKCVFREPQFSTSLSKVVIEGSNAKLGTLDPIGFDTTPGPELYVALMENMASAFVSCFSK